MAMLLFGIIGTAIDAHPIYWICFGIYCVLQVLELVDIWKGDKNEDETDL